MSKNDEYSRLPGDAFPGVSQNPSAPARGATGQDKPFQAKNTRYFIGVGISVIVLAGIIAALILTMR